LKALATIKNKIVSRDNLGQMVSSWNAHNEKVVFTNGCFDIVHQGHIDYLSKAADLGSILIVGVNSDESVKRLGKGENRPLQDEYSRALLIASLQFVDAAVIFNEDTPQSLIEEVIPSVLVKGSDYTIEKIVGHEVVLEAGGEVKTIDFLEGYSTSKIVEKAKN